MFYILTICSTFSVTICTTAFISHLFTLNIYAAGQFQILQRRIQLSFKVTSNVENEEQENPHESLQKCVEKHKILIQYVKLIDHLYSPITFLIAIAAISTICLSGFQLVAGVNTSFHRNALSFEFFSATTIMLFMACYSCQEIIEESLAVADAAYSASVDIYDMTNLDDRNAFMRQLLFIMMRSRKACTIQCFNGPMSIEIFTMVFNRSMSFFAVLRQMLDDS